MARQEIVLFKDDIDGSEKDVRTVKFAFDGHTYEIDLGPKNKAKLQKILIPFIEAGTKVSTRAGARSRQAVAARPAAAQKRFNAKVREWAAANGHKVKPRGRIPQTVIEAYRNAGKS